MFLYETFLVSSCDLQPSTTLKIKDLSCNRKNTLIAKIILTISKFNQKFDPKLKNQIYSYLHGFPFSVPSGFRLLYLLGHGWALRLVGIHEPGPWSLCRPVIILCVAIPGFVWSLVIVAGGGLRLIVSWALSNCGILLGHSLWYLFENIFGILRICGILTCCWRNLLQIIKLKTHDKNVVITITLIDYWLRDYYFKKYTKITHYNNWLNLIITS